MLLISDKGRHGDLPLQPFLYPYSELLPLVAYLTPHPLVL
jgi:hypothetical protein